MRLSLRLTALVLASLVMAGPLRAQSAESIEIESLKGQFTFNWHEHPGEQRCKAVDETLLATFKSGAYACDLNGVTNTESGEPARVCTEKDEGAEYLIFASEKACEAERQAQEANAE